MIQHSPTSSLQLVRQPTWIAPLLSATLILSIVFGQIIRFQIFHGSAGALLISDVLTTLIAIGFWVAVILKRIALPAGILSKGFFAWMTVVLLSTLLAAPHYSHSQIAVALAYLARLFAYISMLFVAYAFLPRSLNLFLRYLVYGSVGLLALGVIILYVLPDFGVLALMGWDPHVERLTSTWFDPNFFGSFLAMLFALFLPFAAPAEQDKRKFISIGYYLFMLLLWLGIYLTYSRSALATFAIGGIAVGLLTRWRNFILVIVLLLVMIALPSRLQSRFAASVNYSVGTVTQSNNNVTGVSTSSVDPTASDRVQSWKKGFSIFKSNPIVGTGYNFYQYYRLEHGQASERDVNSVHGTAGSDSSILTLLATTGIVGTSALLLWGSGIMFFLWKRRKSAFIAGTIGMLIAWVGSSFFNNTLLYPHILLPVMLVIGIALGRPDEDLATN